MARAEAGGVMLLVALAELAVLAATVVAFAGLLRSQQRAHARREDLLLNQLLHTVGKTWTPPPAAADPEDAEPQLPRYIPPDQLPVY